MAEQSQDGQEKTEEPSQRKLQKAREDGQVLSSKEMFVFTTLFAGLVMMVILPMFIQPAITRWSRMFHFERPNDLNKLIGEKFFEMLELIILSGIIIGVPIMIIIIATQAAVGGLNFAPKAMNFKGSRISPLAGLKRIFSVKGLVELVKSLLKVFLLFGVSGVVLYAHLPSLIQLTEQNLNSALASGLDMFPSLLGAMLVILAVIAAIDYFWQRHVHIKQLRMSKQEIKDEYKQTEGSPEVKAKIRRMQMETAQNAGRQQAALEDVPQATAIITNPTHFAVALKYEVGSSEAPKILAMGRGHMAQKIIETGKDSRVTVFRSPLLARALFFTGEIGAEISEQLYQAVAVVLAYLYRLDKGEMLEEPDVDLPGDMQFNETGQKLGAEDGR
ncbi:MAG: flagellar biosynthesis protein FlhB [Candidatus Puniceispirillaceae bacterium]|mgnify:CR=1 FL=1|nr:flagellar biosynthesis protein FlhB [Alphaproteobacteria bacterium]MDB0027810.1 flagellar biosynthesis protein FlhB [Alphaproteobacteria bacterium]